MATTATSTSNPVSDSAKKHHQPSSSSASAKSASPAPAFPGLDAVGTWVRVKTDSNVYEGLVFAYDETFGCVVLQGFTGDAGGGGTNAPGTVEKPVGEEGGRPALPRPLSFAAAAAGKGAAAAPGSSSPSTAGPPSPALNGGGSLPAVASPKTPSTPTTPNTPATPAAAKHDFHIINFSTIKEVVQMGADGKQKQNKVQVPPLVPVIPYAVNKLYAREQAAVRYERERESKLGVGVSAEAQNLFDALAKTMPTTWRGGLIVVLEEIVVSPPYTAEDCKFLDGRNGSETSLERVRKVVRGERERMRSRGGATG
ncbi:hypothetical protein HK104_006236 [Borealophlyctis nickersoniae]|nr:hypothetical protein HK104_006236 [Borealophlyctis nickersoniae]